MAKPVTYTNPKHHFLNLHNRFLLTVVAGKKNPDTKQLRAVQVSKDPLCEGENSLRIFKLPDQQLRKLEVGEIVDCAIVGNTTFLPPAKTRKRALLFIPVEFKRRIEKFSHRVVMNGDNSVVVFQTCCGKHVRKEERFPLTSKRDVYRSFGANQNNMAEVTQFFFGDIFVTDSVTFDGSPREHYGTDNIGGVSFAQFVSRLERYKSPDRLSAKNLLKAIKAAQAASDKPQAEAVAEAA